MTEAVTADGGRIVGTARFPLMRVRLGAAATGAPLALGGVDGRGA